MYEILDGDQSVDIRTRESKRASRLRLTVYCGGEIVVTVPNQAEKSDVEKFIHKKRGWIIKKYRQMRQIAEDYPNLSKNSEEHYRNHKNDALKIANSKVGQWNDDLSFDFNNVRVKQMKTQWGSCTPKKNLHFNYKIKFLAEELQDYLVVHELCHLKEPNHSDRFWGLVKKTLPDYNKRHKQLKKLK